jgi:SAM-dependent methyltransferase
MDWHSRFLQQAAWTHALRTYLFAQAGLTSAHRLLEVGCGTGALLIDLPAHPAVHGLDILPARLAEAHLHAPRAALACGDALRLPYPTAAFDITFCHFLLLWVQHPLQALSEMQRVTRPGGFVLALAEPDYDHRLDTPASLTPLGRWQAESLRRQGADPGIGARLADLFRQTGLQIVETGRLQADDTPALSPLQRELEWAVLEADLAGILPQQELAHLKRLDQAAWEAGQRKLHVPTYFACARKAL